MKRSLMAQMRNEWSDNIWLAIELFIVALIIWGLTNILIKSLSDFNQPRGFEYENVYTAEISRLDSLSPDYVNLGDKTMDANSADLQTLIKSLRAIPGVEAICIGSNMLPYSMMAINTQLMPVGINDSIGYNVNMRRATPEAIEVFRYESLTGRNADDLRNALESGHILLGYYEQYNRNVRPVTSLKGKKMQNMYGNPDESFIVGDIINTVRRSDYEYTPWSGSAIFPLNGDEQINQSAHQIAVRVKPEAGQKFLETVNTTNKYRHLRNTDFSQFQSLADNRMLIQWADTASLRLKIFGISFILIIAFLGLLGTFWFRIQQRTEEIAVRLVCGATRFNIFRRILSESMIILTIAIIPAFILIECLLKWSKAEWLQQFVYYYEWQSVAILAMLATAILMSLMIICGIWMPARKAMSVEPAAALKDE